ncbi:MAG: Thymidylate kinase [Firmicutes bacterium]|nr:Thymidylate kinase [candidate division NPL-UPA2 bacterium]MBT9156268.1 Thymidylate kinase [candidate division NPL-UPA2 bacterium]
MSRGLFISLEGPDGCGKTTQVQALGQAFRQQGKAVICTREPGGTALGEVIRDMLLSYRHTSMGARSEMLLYAASRAQHVEEVILPHLRAGTFVICDRFIDSSLVYQGLGLEIPIAEVYNVNLVAVQACLPDLTVVLKVSVASACARLQAKQAETARGPDRIEARGMEYIAKVSAGYSQLAAMFPKRIVEVDAERDPSSITRDIIEKIHALERGVRV